MQSGQPRASDRHGSAVSPRHSAIPARARCHVLGVPCGARLRTHVARWGSRHLAILDDLLARAARLETAVGPIDVVFGHNDLLAANFLDDGKRLWLVDWEYAGFNSPLFDLGGLASNSELSLEQAEAALELYFDRPVDDELRRRAAAMTAASLLRETMWSMVSDYSQPSISTTPPTRRKICGASIQRMRLGSRWIAHERAAVVRQDRHCRRRHRRLLRRLSSRQDGYHRRTPARAREAHLRLELACRWLVGQLRTSANITQLLGYSVALYDTLEKETGLATGWKRNGGLRRAIKSAGPRSGARRRPRPPLDSKCTSSPRRRPRIFGR